MLLGTSTLRPIGRPIVLVYFTLLKNVTSCDFQAMDLGDFEQARRYDRKGETKEAASTIDERKFKKIMP